MENKSSENSVYIQNGVGIWFFPFRFALQSCESLWST